MKAAKALPDGHDGDASVFKEVKPWLFYGGKAGGVQGGTTGLSNAGWQPTRSGSTSTSARSPYSWNREDSTWLTTALSVPTEFTHMGLQTTCGGNRRPVGLRGGRHGGDDVVWRRSMLLPHGTRL